MSRFSTIAAGSLLAASMLVAPIAALAADAMQEPVQALDDGLIAAMHNGSDSKSFQQRCDALTPVVEHAYNLPAVLKRVIGTRWESIPGDKQMALLDSFRKFTVATYVANFSKFGGEHFELNGERPSPGGDVIVGTFFVEHDGSKVKLDYVVHAINGSGQIVDVLLDGSISRAAVMRSDFRSLLNSGGADALIKHLNDKVSSLANGGHE